jgi:hypothetical protein
MFTSTEVGSGEIGSTGPGAGFFCSTTAFSSAAGAAASFFVQPTTATTVAMRTAHFV